jgi:hypothetical protein
MNGYPRGVGLGLDTSDRRTFLAVTSVALLQYQYDQ